MNPPDPTSIAPHEPTAADIEAFQQWIATGGNPRNMVMKAVAGAVGETVANELWNYLNTVWAGWMNTANVGSVVSQTSGLKNVGAVQEGQFAAYFGSFFPNLMSGGGQGQSAQQAGAASTSPAQPNGYQYGFAVTLINDGFIVSSDGTTWRLHNAADGTIAYETAAADVASGGSAAFAAILAEDGTVYWQPGIDSWEKLIAANNLVEDGTVLKVQVLPASAEAYPYLHPDSEWELHIDGDTPSWYGPDGERAIMDAFGEWKSYVYDFDLDGFWAWFDTLPVEPLTPTEDDIDLLRQWARYKADPANADNKGADDAYPWAGDSIFNDAAQYLNDRFGEIYGQCPGPTVVRGIEATGVTLDAATEDKVGSSVGEKEFLGIFFTNTTRWSASGSADYPYQAIAELWKRGFIPSFDGTTWRLSSGHEGSIVYAATLAELTDGDTANQATSGWVPVAIGATIIAVLVVATATFIRRRHPRATKLP
jgi:hypothetical protein